MNLYLWFMMNKVYLHEVFQSVLRKLNALMHHRDGWVLLGMGNWNFFGRVILAADEGKIFIKCVGREILSLRGTPVEALAASPRFVSFPQVFPLTISSTHCCSNLFTILPDNKKKKGKYHIMFCKLKTCSSFLFSQIFYVLKKLLFFQLEN